VSVGQGRLLLLWRARKFSFNPRLPFSTELQR